MTYPYLFQACCETHPQAEAHVQNVCGFEWKPGQHLPGLPGDKHRPFFRTHQFGIQKWVMSLTCLGADKEK